MLKPPVNINQNQFPGVPMGAQGQPPMGGMPNLAGSSILKPQAPPIPMQKPMAKPQKKNSKNKVKIKGSHFA